MERIIVFIGMLCCMQVAMAQDEISTIRKHYAEAQEMVAEYAAWEKEGEWSMPCPMYYEVNIKQNLPGTGYHKERIRLYFFEKENEEGNADEPMLFRSLHFVTWKYNYAAREFYEEYLYDEKGNIEFAYVRNADMDHFKGGEMRCYFQNSNLFKVLVSIRNEETEKYEQKYSGTMVPKEYARVYEGCQHEIDRFKHLFEEIDGETFH
jgi:hypothetical protein